MKEKDIWDNVFTNLLIIQNELIDLMSVEDIRKTKLHKYIWKINKRR